ncbi:hypothetical protein [Flexibacterium corallicola]|uniref:hypothetical protein n=1 Tax=Flexibacterium corallicola TaxID=3037259 RepID=UPI00286F8214|nr:hypothetical protein [Pseudovibrio sp. M1P-2-3]
MKIDLDSTKGDRTIAAKKWALEDVEKLIAAYTDAATAFWKARVEWDNFITGTSLKWTPERPRDQSFMYDPNWMFLSTLQERGKCGEISVSDVNSLVSSLNIPRVDACTNPEYLKGLILKALKEKNAT